LIKEAEVSKEVHAVRVWAWRAGTRTLVCSLDAPDARRAALARVRKLQDDPGVSRIEMRAHLVTPDEAELPSGRRGSLVWERNHGRWRRLPAGNVHVMHRRGPGTGVGSRTVG
jgi:hypothetical protein